MAGKDAANLLVARDIMRASDGCLIVMGLVGSVILGGVMLVVFFIVFLASNIEPSRPSKPGSVTFGDEIDAQMEVRSAVKATLNYPLTAKFKLYSAHRGKQVEVSGTVTATNAFGVPKECEIRAIFTKQDGKLINDGIQIDGKMIATASKRR